MTEFFDDMWLSLESDLTSYDSFIGDSDWLNINPQTPENSDGMVQNITTNAPNIEPQKYEDLIERTISPPRIDNPHGKTLQERIHAIKEIYNLIPTIINATELARLHKTANTLYKKGMVKAGNQIMEKSEREIQKGFIIAEKNKALEYTSCGKIQVSSYDKELDSHIIKSYTNFYQALKDYLRLG